MVESREERSSRQCEELCTVATVCVWGCVWVEGGDWHCILGGSEGLIIAATDEPG